MFSLQEAFATFNTDRSDLVEVDVDDVEQRLDDLTDALAVAPDAIADESENNYFQSLYYTLNAFTDLDEKRRARLLDLVLTGLQHQMQSLSGIEHGNESIPVLKGLLERYTFLLYWYLIELESACFKGAAAVVHTAPGRQPRSNKVSAEFAEATQQVLQALEVVCAVLKLNLGAVFVTSSENDLYTGLLLKPVYLLMESEQLMKNSQAKLYMFKTICLAVKSHKQQSNVHTALMQMLIYFEHLPELLGELLQIMYEQYDHTAITDEILKELSNRSYNSNDTKGPKFVSLFVVKLSQLVPQVLLRQMTCMVKLLEAESFTLRCAVIEATGNIIFHLAKQGDALGTSSEEDGKLNEDGRAAHLNSLMDLVEERVLDINPYARARALQVLVGICELEQKYTSRRQSFTKTSVAMLKDKSVIVRRNSLKLLSRLVATHPFALLHGTQLSLIEWKARLAEMDAQLEQVLPAGTAAEEEANDQSMQLDAPSDDESDEKQARSQQEEMQKANENTELIQRLKLTRKYYLEAIAFIERLHDGVETCENLLFSKNKSEIIDAMDFLVLCEAYGIEIAQSGIRKMIHLIWAKANNDEGHQIQAHLISCYRTLFFDPPLNITEADASLIVARNLISLTYSATLAELASLEHLLVMAMKNEESADEGAMINAGVIKMLWKIYSYQQREISKSQRRGAVIILGMLAKADSSIATIGLELLMKIGLGELGHKDLGLAKYTCIALQQCVPDSAWKVVRSKESGGPFPPRYPKEHDVIERLCELLLMPFSSMDWFGVAEQAVDAINSLCETPDVVFSKVIKVKSAGVFGAQQAEAEDNKGKQASLSQLLFIVGEVALKTMVHLERCEALFKRSKISVEKANASKRNNEKSSKKKGKSGKQDEEDDQEDELEMVGGGNGGSGTTEDDFSEAVAYIREREMLYGDRSLLARFGPMVADVCKQALRKPLQDHINVSATLCLSKFMCCSGRYCEENLPILMTLLERSDSSHIRSNCVLALGDIAVMFNHILDDNTDFLYRRLHDKYPVVQRTCLMTLTFLILAGQVKVKGQLGEMAKCLEDPDQRIASLSRMFFTELATKDNAIYNGFIDMFSVLSADQRLQQESLHKILKFLMSFIDKDKQIKNLADKLHSRMAKCDSPKTWTDIAYVLNNLPHKNEDITKSINEGFKYIPVRVE